MRQTTFSLFLSLLMMSTTLYGQSPIYVNRNATGQNNGSSWMNAYTNLQSALNNAQSSTREIWVATGTYYGGFNIVGNLKLYGGFAGTETLRSQRDWNTYLTILSGDIGQDDLSSPLDTVTQMIGTNQTVLTISTMQVSRQEVDGFVITAGKASGPAEIGGGIGFFETIGVGIDISVRNCLFQGNQGLRGGGLGLEGIGPILVEIENCQFIKNFATRYGGGALIVSQIGYIFELTIERSLFERNYAANRGGGLSKACSGSPLPGETFLDTTRISNTIFKHNLSGGTEPGGTETSALGGGAYLESEANAGEVLLDSCQFIGNISQLPPGTTIAGARIGGGGIYFTTTNLIDTFLLEFNDCQFTQNQTGNLGQGAGGAIDIQNALTGTALQNQDTTGFLDTRIHHCTFNENTSRSNRFNMGGTVDYRIFSGRAGLQCTESIFEDNHAFSGGGLSLQALNTGKIDFFISESTFFQNQVNDKGGAIAVHANSIFPPSPLTGRIDQCQFEQNSASAGGAILLEPRQATNVNWDIQLVHNHFHQNQSTGNGGAISLESGSMNKIQLELVQDTFFQNVAGGVGGAFAGMASGSGEQQFEIQQLIFEENKADQGGGLAIGGDPATERKLSLRNSFFQSDSAREGGAIYLDGGNMEADIENLLATHNHASSFGGGLYANTTQKLELNIKGATFTENSCNVFGQVFYLSNLNGQPIQLDMGNSILWNNGLDIDIFTIGTQALYQHVLNEESLPGTNNLEEDPQFEAPQSGNYQLRWSSPAVDAGLDSLALETTDLVGNTRIQGMNVDLGALESTFTTSLPVETPTYLQVYPNPTHNQVYIEVPYTTATKAQLLVMDLKGQIYQQATFSPLAQSTYQLSLGELATGMYLVQLQLGEQLYQQKVEKY